MHGSSNESLRIHGGFPVGGSIGDVDLQELIAHLVISSGMTWEQVREQFDIPRIGAMQRYWTDNPPLHQLVAAYFGYSGKKQEDQDLSTLLNSIPEVKR